MDFSSKQAKIELVAEIMQSKAELLSVRNISNSAYGEEYSFHLEGQTLGLIKMISRTLLILAKESKGNVNDLIQFIQTTCEVIQYSELRKERPTNIEELLSSLEQIFNKSDMEE